MSEFFDDVEDAMDQQLKDDAAARDAADWDPEEGDILKGIFLKLNGPILTKFGSTWLALVKDLADDEVKNVWLSRSILRKEMVDAAPKPGGEVAIRFVGERETRDGSNSYYLYQVRVPEGGQDKTYWHETMHEYEPVQRPQDDEDEPKESFLAPDEAPF